MGHEIKKLIADKYGQVYCSQQENQVFWRTACVPSCPFLLKMTFDDKDNTVHCIHVIHRHRTEPIPKNDK